MMLRTITRNLAQYYLVQFEDEGIAILSNDKIFSINNDSASVKLGKTMYKCTILEKGKVFSFLTNGAPCVLKGDEKSLKQKEELLDKDENPAGLPGEKTQKEETTLDKEEEKTLEREEMTPKKRKSRKASQRKNV